MLHKLFTTLTIFLFVVIFVFALMALSSAGPAQGSHQPGSGLTPARTMLPLVVRAAPYTENLAASQIQLSYDIPAP